MKAKVIGKEPKFNPIVLEITIESKDELLELYARLNASWSMIKEAAHPDHTINLDNSRIMGLWSQIKQLVLQLPK